MGVVRLEVSGPTSTCRRRGPRHERRAAPGPQRGRDAHLVPRALNAIGQRAARDGAGLSLQQIFGWCSPRRLGDGRAVAGRPDDRQPARDPHGAERVRGLLATRADEGRRWIPARSRLRPTRCAGSRTSRRSASRSAESARWSRAEARPGAARHPRDGCRDAGELRHRHDRGVPAVIRRRQTAGPLRHRRRRRVRSSRRAPARTPAMAVGAGIGTRRVHRATSSEAATSLRRNSPLAGGPGHRPSGQVGGRGAGGRHVAALAGRAHFYEGHRLDTVDLRDARPGACSA